MIGCPDGANRIAPYVLAAAFVLYGLLATVFLAINMPPYQNPDETAHFMRAAQVAEGRVIGTRFARIEADGQAHVLAGDAGDIAIALAFFPFDPIRGHPETKATRSMWAGNIHWGRARVMLPNTNTAANPPLFYVPGAIGVLIGRAARMTVVQTLALSRLLTGVAAVAVGALAIATAEGAAVWLFALLTLPMALAQIASTSQDSLLLACSALAGALLVRALRVPGARDRTLLIGLVAMLILVATARPPYGALALLPLALKGSPWRSRLLAAALVVAAVLAWSGIAAATALTNVGQGFGADPPAQLARLRADPLLLVHATWSALALHWRGLLEMFVGRLGWYDLELPQAYRTAALAMLGVAALAAMTGLRGQRIGAGSRLAIAAGVLLSAAGLFAIEYVTWTAPGAPIVEGVAGRYFLPLALAGAALLPAFGHARWARLHAALVLAVAAFPVVTLTVVMRAVVLRYYLG